MSESECIYIYYIYYHKHLQKLQVISCHGQSWHLSPNLLFREAHIGQWIDLGKPNSPTEIGCRMQFTNMILWTWWLRPRKLTCPLKRDYFNRKYIFQPSFFRDMLVFRWVCPTCRKSLCLPLSKHPPQHAVDGSEIRPSPPAMYKTRSIMGYLPYQLVSRISEPSTWWFIYFIMFWVSRPLSYSGTSNPWELRHPSSDVEPARLVSSPGWLAISRKW